MAADIRIQGVDVETLATYAETLLKNTGGIGRYPVKLVVLLAGYTSTPVR